MLVLVLPFEEINLQSDLSSTPDFRIQGGPQTEILVSNIGFPLFSLNRPHWADSVIETPCPSVCPSFCSCVRGCVPSGAVFFEASH